MAKLDTHSSFLMLLFAIVFAFQANTQVSVMESLGVPFVDSYDNEIYRAGVQNWDISQDELGLIYIANNDGMLVYDGSEWTTYRLPDKTLTRSLAISNNRIYIGGQNEFGYFKNELEGGYVFTSQAELFDEKYRDFEDVWDMHATENVICFRSSSRIYYIIDGKASVFDKDKVKFLTLFEDTFYAQTTDGKLLQFANGIWTELVINGVTHLDIKGISSLSDGSLFILSQFKGAFTYTNGSLVPWDNPYNKTIIEARGQQVTKINDDVIAIGTATSGILIMHRDGFILSMIGIEEGLISNKIQALFVDNSLNLWVGMNKGISLVYTNSPFTRITPDIEQGGIGYSTVIHNENLYAATDNGVYYKPLAEHSNEASSVPFKKVKNSDGQAWGLDLVRDELYLSHNRGGFIIDEDQATQIYDKNGLWLFQSDLRSASDVIIGGYEGIFSDFTLSDDISKIQPKDNLNESSRFIVQENENLIWVAHPYRGIFKIKRSDNSVELLGANNGLPSDLHNHVFKINNQLLFCGETGIYTYNQNSNSFSRNTEYDSYFDSNEKVRRLYASPNGDIWFITSREVGVLKISDLGLKKEVEKIVFPFLRSQMNDGFENIYIHDSDNVFISTIKGFVHYNANRSLRAEQSQKLVLTSLVTDKSSNKIETNVYSTIKKNRGVAPLELPLNAQSIRFDFNVINYSLDRSYTYRWKLDGFDSNWTRWSSEQTKEYTNLDNGNYDFHLEARRGDGKYLSLVQSFQIQAPWHTSFAAKICYALLAAVLVYILFVRNRQQYVKLKNQVDQTVRYSKEEIKRIENERIKSELEHKKRELISTTLNLVKKNETFLALKNNLLEMKTYANDERVQTKIRSTLRLLDQEELNAQNWEQFMFHFNELNGDFVERLQTTYSNLTPKDIKMCTYLKMNLSSKEISQLLNVTIRAVEASRYRLRKKIHLDSKENLNEFFMRY